MNVRTAANIFPPLCLSIKEAQLRFVGNPVSEVDLGRKEPKADPFAPAGNELPSPEEAVTKVSVYGLQSGGLTCLGTILCVLVGRGEHCTTAQLAARLTFSRPPFPPAFRQGIRRHSPGLRLTCVVQ